MGANAVTTVPVYVAGEVLTAADLNITNSGIPVFASTVERDAAFGGTGEKTLAEGQFAFLEDTNTTQFYDGATWQAVGVAPGLVLVKTQTIGSAVSSVAVTDAFSATYDSYRIIISGGVGSTLQSIAMILGASTTGYYRGATQIKYSSAGESLSSDNNAASWTAAGVASTNAISFDNTLVNPFLAKTTGIAGVFGFHDTSGDSRYQGGYHNVASSFTGFTISVAGTLTGGTIRVYGFANS
jgi:hypothetical protein